MLSSICEKIVYHKFSVSDFNTFDFLVSHLSSQTYCKKKTVQANNWPWIKVYAQDVCGVGDESQLPNSHKYNNINIHMRLYETGTFNRSTNVLGKPVTIAFLRIEEAVRNKIDEDPGPIV